MKPAELTRATRDYFLALHFLVKDVLGTLLQASGTQNADILATEQVIQDYLATAFRPFVGATRIPRYIRDQVPLAVGQLEAAAGTVIAGRLRFGLIGAHYRSSLSAKGRRSAFGVHRQSFLASLQDLLGDDPSRERLKAVKADVLEAVWEAVYLEQYFALFDRKLTLGEWAFEQKKKVPIVVLAESSAATRQAEEFRSELHFQHVIVVPERLTGVLLSKSLLQAFARGVAAGIVGAIDKERASLSYLMRHNEDYPDRGRIGAWSRLVRSANALARDAIAQNSIDKDLALRHSYATGMVLYQPAEHSLREELLRLFPGSTADQPPGQQPSERDQLAKLLRVLQSLQFYTMRYGENCATLPHRSGAAIPGNLEGGEEFQSSITLFWKGSRNLGVLHEIVEGARKVFTQVNTLVENRPRHPQAPPAREDHRDREVLKIISGASDGRLDSSEVHAVLVTARDLSRALHEGKPRAFSFILGSPEWLISDLSVVHDLMGIGFRYRVTGGERYDYDRTLALLRGNSAFFQDDSLALFLPYPGRPLEVTHVVRLPREGSGRRQLLSSFSKGKKAVIAVATYGSGSGELIHQGEVRAVLSAEGQWVPADGYQSLIGELGARIAELGATEAGKIVERLEPCLRRLSEEPGVGGLFVIAREVAANRLRKESISLTEVLETIDGRSLPELDARAVYDLARDDGATIVAVPSMRVWGRRLLAAGSGLLRSSEPDTASDWPLKSIQMLEWGTRRRTALRVSRNLGGDGLVVVVSADGPINLLQRGAIVAQFGERSYTQSGARAADEGAGEEHGPHVS